MFDIGFWEVVVVLVVALVVVGPDRLPGLAREVGTWVRKLRRFVTSVRSDIEHEFRTEELRKLLDEQHKEINELKNMMRDTGESLRNEIEETSHLVKSIENDVKEGGPPSSPDAESEQVDERASDDRHALPGEGAGEATVSRKDRDEPQS